MMAAVWGAWCAWCACTTGLAITTVDEQPQQAQWVWCTPDRQPGVAARFEKHFTLGEPATRAWLRCAGESASIDVYVNGRHVTSRDPYEQVFFEDVTMLLAGGDNLLEVAARSCAGPAAFFTQLEITLADGTRRVIASNSSWRTRGSSEDPQAAIEFGKVSDKLLVAVDRRVSIMATDNYEQWRLASTSQDASSQARFKLSPGFEIQLIHQATMNQGSWVSMAFDSKGRLVVAKEKRGLLRLTLSQDGNAVERVETIDDSLQECRGLLFVGDELYTNANNSKALYRLSPNGRDGYQPPREVFRSTGGVGHGRNDLALGPDGQIYSIHGDAVDLPTEGRDCTSPFREARRGHPTREGHLLRIDPKSGNVELFAAGLRNPYGVAFNQNGDVFTYDADAEYDMGAPWYRPTRVSHLVRGGDYGWRGVTKQWPPYYPDHPDNALPNLDIGKGSPTAVTFGTRSKFPPKYREALFVLDWAYGRILAIHLVPLGSSYWMMGETFLKGRPLNVTDVAFGPDGAMYLITGGRGTQSSLYRVSYRGPHLPQQTQPTDQQRARAVFAEQSRLRRRKLESFLVNSLVESDWPFVLESLGDSDPRIRYAARNVVERHFSEPVADRLLQLRQPTASIAAMMVLARSGQAKLQQLALTRLNQLDWAHERPENRLAAAYCYWRIFGNGEAISENDRRAAVQRVLQAFPDRSFAVNRFLSEIVVREVPEQAVPLTMELLQTALRQEEQLHYLFVLRNVRKGWTESTRRVYFQYLQQAEDYVGGEGMPTFLRRIRDEALSGLSEFEREAVRDLWSKGERPTAPLDGVARPFVRRWTVDEAVEVLNQLQRTPDLRRGAEMFDRAFCSKCHRMGRHGAAIGPDLTSVASRFSRRDLLTSIVEPSKVVAEKYRSLQVVTQDGRSYVGQVVQIGDYRSQTLRLATDPLHPDQIVEIDKRQIEQSKESTTSFMPERLIDILDETELHDLIAYIESGGIIAANADRPSGRTSGERSRQTK